MGMMMLIGVEALALRLPMKLGSDGAKKATAMTTAGATAVFAGFELSESLWELGHHHGVALIALSKMAQATALVANSGKEALEETSTRMESYFARKRLPFLRLVFVFALFAALWEVIQDVRPGGHHSTALIAMAELRDTSEGAGLRFFKNCWAKLLLGLGALAAASLELSREFFNCGAHHGAFLLASSIVIKSGGEVINTILHRPEKLKPFEGDSDETTTPVKVA